MDDFREQHNGSVMSRQVLRLQDVIPIAVLSAMFGAAGLIVINLPAIVDERAGFFALFLVIAICIGLVAGAIGGLVAKVTSSVLKAAGFGIPAVAGALTGGLTVWLLSSAGNLINPVLLSAIFAAVVFVVTFAVLQRRVVKEAALRRKSSGRT